MCADRWSRDPLRTQLRNQPPAELNRARAEPTAKIRTNSARTHSLEHDYRGCRRLDDIACGYRTCAFVCEVGFSDTTDPGRTSRRTCEPRMKNQPRGSSEPQRSASTADNLTAHQDGESESTRAVANRSSFRRSCMRSPATSKAFT